MIVTVELILFSSFSNKKAMCDIAKARASKLPEDTNRKQSNGN